MSIRYLSSCLPWRGFLKALAALALLAALSGGATGARAGADGARRSSSAMIRTLDLDATVRWYQDNLGFRQVSVENFTQSRRVVLERQGFLLEITVDERSTPSAPGAEVETTGSVTDPVVSLLVPDVDRETSRLRKSGVEIVQTPGDDLDGNFRTSVIGDNDHRPVELREPLGSPGVFNPTGR